MAFTDSCDVFGSIHEDAMNRVVRHLMLQRPALFNYGTQLFAAQTQLLCRRIEAHPEVSRRHNPLITVEDPLPILGTGGALGLDFCAQLTKVEVDLAPGNLFALPPELSPLGAQRFAFHAEACAAIVCPRRDLVERLGDLLAEQPIRLPGQTDPNDQLTHLDPDRPRPPIQPVPGSEPFCFCLNLFGVGHVEIRSSSAGLVLAGRLDGLEIVDIEPRGLENSLECYLATTIRLSLLPRLRVSLDAMIFALGSFASLTVTPTPPSPAVPNSLAVEDNLLKAFVNVGV